MKVVCRKMNSITDSDDFTRLQPKSFGVWSEIYSGGGRKLIPSDLIGKFLISTSCLIEHPQLESLIFWFLFIYFWLFPFHTELLNMCISQLNVHTWASKGSSLGTLWRQKPEHKSPQDSISLFLICSTSPLRIFSTLKMKAFYWESLELLHHKLGMVMYKSID